jgi:small subunit ribosomal protein S20
MYSMPACLKTMSLGAFRFNCRIPRDAGNVSCWLARNIRTRSFARYAAGNHRFPSSAAPPRTPVNEKVIHVANIKSQIKRIGTNKKAQDRNKAVKSELKTAVRATREAVLSGDKAAAAASLTVAAKKLDKAVSKGVIHENQAANRKSAIAKQVAAL